MEPGNSYFGGNFSFILTNTCYVMVWCGMVLDDMVCCGILWYIMVWYGMV